MINIKHILIDNIESSSNPLKMEYEFVVVGSHH